MTMQYQWTEWDEDVDSTPDEEYQSLVRSLRRKMGFGLFFVRCSPVGGQELIKRVRADVPQKQAVLELKEPISNLIDLVTAFPDISNIKILFIVGLDKSLVEYIRTGYGGQGDYYNLDNVPPILSHLNWQRENFRDRFPYLCFVFLLPQFAIKYIIRRAPDFYDWGLGKINFPMSEESREKELSRVLLGNYEEYLQWTPQQRKECIIEINEFLLEPNQTQDQKASLLLKLGDIFYVNEQYKEAITAFDRALEIKPDLHQAWNDQGNVLGDWSRYEEAITSYDKALQIKPDDYHQAWYNRGIALGHLGRHEEAIVSYDRALKIKPDLYEAWNNRGVELSNLGKYKEASTSFDKAIEVISSLDKTTEIKSTDYKPFHNQGLVKCQLGKYDEAIEPLSKATMINHQSAKTWKRLGDAQLNTNRVLEAIASLDRSWAIDPTDLETKSLRDIAYKLIDLFSEKGETSISHSSEKIQITINRFSEKIQTKINRFSEKIQSEVLFNSENSTK
jgi:tetratricopeptide (TPR) repeat protein